MTDFSHADDSLAFQSSIFTAAGLPAAGLISAAQFTSSASITASGQIFLYDTDSGNLFYDADAAGASAAINVATLNISSALAYDDIIMTPATSVYG